MRKNVNYFKLIKNALNSLKKINKLAEEFAKYEMVESVKNEIDEILELSDFSEHNGKDKSTYGDIMDDFCQIEDDLSEVEMITGELIKDVNKMPKEVREEFYNRVGITEIEKEDEGICEQRLGLIHEMIGLVEDVLDESGKYFDHDKEDYVDYVDEMNKDKN